MRTLLMACAACAALLAAGAALPGPANAMPLAPVAAPRLADNVAHFCHRERRCALDGGCGRVTTCGWRDSDRDVFVFVRPTHSWYPFYHEPAYHPWTYRSDYSHDWYW